MPQKSKILNQKWKRFLLEFFLIFWLLSCLYVWWILNGNPGISVLSKLSPKVTVIVQDSFARIWPYVWRQYIFVK